MPHIPGTPLPTAPPRALPCACARLHRASGFPLYAGMTKARDAPTPSEVPASAGTTDLSRPSLASCLRRNDETHPDHPWIPACAGMAEGAREWRRGCWNDGRCDTRHLRGRCRGAYAVSEGAGWPAGGMLPCPATTPVADRCIGVASPLRSVTGAGAEGHPPVAARSRPHE